MANDDYKTPDRDHLSDILTEWAPKINMWVKKLRSSGKVTSDIDDTDLHTAGMDGLMDAFHRYEKNKGAFAPFVDGRIRGKMLDHVSVAAGGANAVDKYHREQAKAFKAKQAIKPISPKEES